MVEDAFEQGGVAVAGEHLVFVVRKIGVGAVGAEGDAFDYGGGHVFEVELPHFFCIGAKEQVGQVATDVGVEIVGGVGWVGVRDGDAGEVFGDFVSGFQVGVKDCVDGIEVDRQGHMGAGGEFRTDFVLVGHELGELGEPLDDCQIFGVEEVRPVAVDADAVRVGFVIGVAGDMGAPIDHIDMETLLGEDTCMDGARETGTDDQDFGHLGHGEKSGWNEAQN